MAELLTKIDFEGGKHDEIWAQFEEACQKCIKFNFCLMVPINEEGRKLVKDGFFLTSWLKAICLNPFINSDLVVKQAYTLYFGGIEAQK